MAKQNADTQIVSNHSPTAVLVFIKLDDQGVPIRASEAMIIPDILDVKSVSTTLGSTGKIGRFTATISNTNNKYFVADDISKEISNLNLGTAIIETGTSDNLVYGRLSSDDIWTSASEFLQNRVFNRIIDNPPVVNIYYQDLADSYGDSVIDSKIIPNDIKQILKKGVIKFRTIPSSRLEEFSKANNFAKTRKGEETTDSSLATTYATVATRQSELREEAAREKETYLGPTAASLSQNSPINSNTIFEALVSPELNPDLAPGEGSKVRTQTSLSSAQKDSDKYFPEYTTERTVSLDDAIRLLQVSDVQSAFYEKYGGQLEHGRCVFEPMQQCVILMSRRFKDDSDPDDLVVTFTGYVDVVEDSFDGDEHSLIITGSDVTKIMNITQANINPSSFLEKLPGGQEYKIWQNRFGGLEGWEIIKLLTIGGDLELGQGKIFGSGVYEVSATVAPGTVDTTSVFSNKISSVSLLNGLGKTPTEASGEESDRLDRMFFSKKTVHIQTLPFDSSPTQQLQSYDVFKKIFGISLGNWQNEYQSHLEIATEVARLTNYEFYADGQGDIWYHQPRFHNYHILTNTSPETYVLRDDDILSSTFSESDEDVITSVYVTGQPNYYEGPKEITKMVGFYEDPSLVLKYGRRMVSISHPYVVSEGDINFFAKSWLVRANASRFVGKVTILGRPELRAHMPVFIPYRNMVYYIMDIQHSLSFGDQSITVLTLKYGHKPWEIIPEILDYTERGNPRLSSQVSKRDPQPSSPTSAGPSEADLLPAIEPEGTGSIGDSGEIRITGEFSDDGSIRYIVVPTPEG